MRTWILPQSLLDASIKIMQPSGRLGNEGLALWLGREEHGDVARVTHVLDVRGAGVRAGPLQLQISERAMARITDAAADLETFLVGQIHSHPGDFIELSDVDQIYGIRIEGYLSMVCPHYAQMPNTQWHQCGFHVFEGAQFRQMAQKEVTARVRFDDAELKEISLEVPK